MLDHERRWWLLDHRPNARHVQDIGRAKGRDEKQGALVSSAWRHSHRGCRRVHHLVERRARRPRLGQRDAKIFLYRLGCDVHSRFEGAQLSKAGETRYAARSLWDVAGCAWNAIRRTDRQLPMDPSRIYRRFCRRRRNGIANPHDRRAATNRAVALSRCTCGVLGRYCRVYPFSGHQPGQTDGVGFRSRCRCVDLHRQSHCRSKVAGTATWPADHV